MPAPSAATKPVPPGAFPLAHAGGTGAAGAAGIEALEIVLAAPSFDYAGLVAEMLEDALPGRHRLSHFPTLAGALERLRQIDADCLLLDIGVPDANGLIALGDISAVDPHVPVALIIGLDQERTGIESLQAGAQDYLVRGQTNSYVLARSIRYAIERKRAELELAHRAMHDALTDLPNRALFEDRLGQALSRQERDGGELAVMYVDIDRFKAVNARLGHDAGDRVICRMATRLREAVRPADTVARFGGDDFMVLCEDIHSAREAERIADRIAGSVSEPLVTDDERLELTASIGIALAMTSAAEAGVEELIRAADAAMGHVKQRGGAGRHVFDEEVRSRSSRRAAVERDLRRAIERGELRVHYQPQVDLDSGATVGFEALVRWEHPERGLVPAADFIPYAEEIGLIDAIDAWVLRQACVMLRRWSESSSATISVNLSARGLERSLLVEEIAETITGSGIDPSRLSLEITESSAIQHDEPTLERLHALKTLGVNVGLDDFGTGYASLSALSHFPLDILKIDRSFVIDLSTDANKKRIVAATISLAHALGLTAVAEGVERREDLAELKALGCRRAQGHLFARAQPDDAVDPGKSFSVTG